MSFGPNLCNQTWADLSLKTVVLISYFQVFPEADHGKKNTHYMQVIIIDS